MKNFTEYPKRYLEVLNNYIKNIEKNLTQARDFIKKAMKEKQILESIKKELSKK